MRQVILEGLHACLDPYRSKPYPSPYTHPPFLCPDFEPTWNVCLDEGGNMKSSDGTSTVTRLNSPSVSM
ncbi:hypothetical protein CDAR_234201 [Caerostris darwini]|uniref:Uncharacterized protein n=1 Tax=Caerostris darwini TaxID=1538125 RepID=A0AAV4QIB3_9ARAC|nr:hypothetical protein CDAR_234201 [Caerostris darwini]